MKLGLITPIGDIEVTEYILHSLFFSERNSHVETIKYVPARPELPLQTRTSRAFRPLALPSQVMQVVAYRSTEPS